MYNMYYKYCNIFYIIYKDTYHVYLHIHIYEVFQVHVWAAS